MLVLSLLMNGRVVIVGLVCLMAGMIARGDDFARYQVILNRMPFGVEPTPESLAAALAKPEPPRELFTRNLKMCAVTRNLLNGDVQVGLMDLSTKKNYFLRVGETEDGITVVEADYEGETALLRKDGDEERLGMSDAVAMTTVTSPAGASAARAGVAKSVPRGISPRQAVREVKVAPPKLTGEALEKHLQSYQMDLIRAGGEKGPPLPMELTPEMDEQLVNEGVLPPME
jgi:hypothetical protein